MTTIVLYREDINSPLHPRFWEELCEDLGQSTDSDSLTITVAKSSSDVAEVL